MPYLVKQSEEREEMVKSLRKFYVDFTDLMMELHPDNREDFDFDHWLKQVYKNRQNLRRFIDVIIDD